MDYFDSVLIRDLKREDFEGLDREILEWYETVPASIRIDGLSNHIPVPGTATYNIERLQIWTRLRLNQVRIAQAHLLTRMYWSILMSAVDSNLAIYTCATHRIQHNAEQ